MWQKSGHQKTHLSEALHFCLSVKKVNVYTLEKKTNCFANNVENLRNSFTTIKSILGSLTITKYNDMGSSCSGISSVN